MRFVVGFALGFSAAFVVTVFGLGFYDGRRRLQAEFDPYAKPFGDWPYLPTRPNGWERTFTEEVH